MNYSLGMGFVNLQPTPQIDLSTCDREPIHLLGTIMPHGAMIACDTDGTIRHAAGDCATLLGTPTADLVGQPVETLFSPGQWDLVRSLGPAIEQPRHLLFPLLSIPGALPTDASVHHSDGLTLIEYEAAQPADANAADPLGCVRLLLDGLDAAGGVDAYCREAAARLRGVIGYDRVMVYRFAPNGDGEVIAESCADGIDSFLGLRYPASDIPQQARALYVRNALRLIADLGSVPSPIVPALNPLTARPLDLGQAVLRDVSPVHRLYLRNMGVAASMSLSIIRDGKLWGLFACHHHSPRNLPRHLRAICELFGSMFSLQLDVRERSDALEHRLASRKVLQQIMLNMAAEEDFADALVNQSPGLLEYIEADGAAVRVERHGGIAVFANERLAVGGRLPGSDQILGLIDWLGDHMGPDDLFATDRLADHWAPARDFVDVGAGLLAFALPREPRDYVLWFRPEVARTVRWGGDPAKPVSRAPDGETLTPRASFAEWIQQVRGQSEPWGPADRAAATELRVALLEIVLRRIDAAERERARSDAHQNMLMLELDHRVKNTLANIQALVSQTGRTAVSLTDYVIGLEGRIGAMSRAHSLLTSSRWEGASLSGLLNDELAPYADGMRRIRLDGPDILLTPKAALALSLALHELATNSAKYGAFSVPDGAVVVQWSLCGEILLSWREVGGPSVAEPLRRGFGSTLIERSLVIETGGSSILRFPEEGCECEIRIPLSAIAHRPSFKPRATLADPTSTGPARDRPLSVLVVEDSSLVLMMIEDAILDSGWAMVGPATRVDEALRLAETETFDIALLDINLDGEMSWAVAALLKSRGIPFLFSTGYDGAAVLPPEFSNEAIIAKPFTAAILRQRLSDLRDMALASAARTSPLLIDPPLSLAELPLDG